MINSISDAIQMVTDGKGFGIWSTVPQRIESANLRYGDFDKRRL